jgi:serine/threonine protein kinase
MINNNSDGRNQRRGTSANRESRERANQSQYRRCCFWTTRTRVDNPEQMSSNSRTEGQGESSRNQFIHGRPIGGTGRVMGGYQDTREATTFVLSKNNPNAIGGYYATRNGQRRPSSFTDACVSAKGRFDQQGFILETNLGQIYAFRKCVMGGFGKKISDEGKTFKDTGTTVIREIRDRGRTYVYKRVKKQHRLGKLEYYMWKELSSNTMLKRYITPLVTSFSFDNAYHYISDAYATDLFYLTQKKPTTKYLLDILLQIGNAIVSLHQHGYAHLDIKPENILVDGHRAVLCDFATTTKIKGDEEVHLIMRIGTVEYCAPEIFEGVVVKKSDVYSFAKTIFVSIYKRMPNLSTMHPHFYGDWYDLFACCLQEIREDRINSIHMYKKLYALKDVNPYFC